MATSRIRQNDLSRFTRAEKIGILELVSGIIDTGVFLKGSRVQELESSLTKLLEARGVLGVANGSEAIYLALRALKFDKCYEVATVGNASGYATNAILRCRAKPVLVEIDPITAQMASADLERALRASPQLSVVILTHLYGQIGNVSEIAMLCSQYGALLIEDCAQSFGAQLDGRRAGSWGDAAAFSFYPTKNLAALGDGGMVAFKDSEACDRARKIAQYGWSSRYEVELPDGINSRLDEIQAAVVLHRLGSVDSRNSRRRDILRRYAEAVTMPRRFIFEDSERCVAHLAVMRTPTRDRDRTILNDHGIDTAIHYPIPDHHQPAWQHLFGGVSLPNTEAHCQEVLTLPCFPELTEEETARVCEALQSL